MSEGHGVDSAPHSSQSVELETLTAMARSLAMNQSPEELGQQVVEWAQVLLPRCAARVWLIADDGRSRRLMASIGLVDEPGERRLTAMEGLGSVSTGEAKVITTLDVRTEPRFLKKDWAHRQGLISSIMLPLVHRGRVYGNISIFLREKHEFSAQEIRVLESFAAMAASAFGSAWHYRKSQQQTTRLETLNGVIAEMVRELDSEAVLRRIVEESAKLLELDGAGLRMRSGNMLKIVHGTGSSVSLMVRESIPIGDGPSGLVALKGEAMTFDNIPSNPELSETRRLLAVGDDIQSWVGVPVNYNGQLIGVLQGASKRQRRFSQEEISLLSAFADYAAIALENARLYSEAQAELLERRAAEQALREHQLRLEDVVAERTEALKMTQQQLIDGERLATLGRVAGSVAHELRTPLGTIDASCRILEKTGSFDNQRSRGAVDRVLRNVDCCVRLMEELVDFTRGSSAAGRAIDVGQWLTEMVADEPTLNSIGIHAELPSGLMATIDEDRFRRVMINLLHNASHSLPETGEASCNDAPLIALRCRRGADGVEIEVEDQGHGIAEDVLPQIFEPLFSTKGFGMGLGLAIVRQIVEEHGGRISVDSAEARGTRITVVLPHAESEIP